MNLKGLDLPELQGFVEAQGQPRFRGQQLFRWLYGGNARSFADMTNLPKGLRENLASAADLSAVEVVDKRQSRDGQSVKFLFRLQDRQVVESVWMTDAGRTTLCLSTQVGCAIDCKFCATGSLGLNRNLTAGEIVDQLLVTQLETGQQISNIVFMGMGEPLQNYDNVLKACSLICHQDGPAMSRRHIVISTSGIIPKIRQFADEGHKYRLAISLNATTDEVRSRLMPLNQRWPLGELFKAAKYYAEKSSELVTFEYVLLRGINDSVEDAFRLKKYLAGLKCKLNLIPYNEAVGEFQRPAKRYIERFYEMLSGMRAPVMIRWSKGDDIEAGCGQLAAKATPAHSAV